MNASWRTLITAAIALVLVAVDARASGMDWHIQRYDSEIEVVPDGTLRIRESLRVDFTREPHRGIYRDIPYAYEHMGMNFKVRVRVVSVTDGSGEAQPYVTSRERGRLRIRIGDPDVFHQEVRTYEIVYTVRRGLLRLDTHDELYWNAIGHEWAVPIAEGSCTVILPDAVPARSVQTASFRGQTGSTAEGPTAQELSDGRYRFDLTRRLAPRSGLTVVVGWSPGHVSTPDWATRLWWFVSDNLILILPPVYFGLLWLLWRTRGRDLGQVRPVTVQYDAPEGLTPIEVGTIIDERIDLRDLTATLVGLAVRGYITLDAGTKGWGDDVKDEDITFFATGKPWDDLKDFEVLLLEKLFDGKRSRELSDLEHEFHSTLPKIKEQVYAELDRKGLFDGNFTTRRASWVGLGCVGTVLTGIGLFLLLESGLFARGASGVAMALCTPLPLIFSFFMPRKTAAGRRTLEHVKGLEEYIRRAEREELDRAAAQGRFERLLPYAMALGMGRQWAKRFEGLYEQPPEWFRARGSHWSPLLLHTTLASASSRIGSTLSSVPRAQGSGGSGFGGGSSGFGGGFSGGGGGGGGGGAW